ncbi:hypothetical protein TNCV_440041 [Trichonephila clavipes]|nr:hypothetical protein TNCV_440041 [Trichonephila clavipes]
MKCQVSAKVLKDTVPFLPKKSALSFPKDHSEMVPIERRSFLLSFPGVLYSSAHVNNYSHYNWSKPERAEVESERITVLSMGGRRTASC